mgnify:CR=1 FL=1
MIFGMKLLLAYLHCPVTSLAIFVNLAGKFSVAKEAVTSLGRNSHFLQLILYFVIYFAANYFFYFFSKYFPFHNLHCGHMKSWNSKFVASGFCPRQVNMEFVWIWKSSHVFHFLWGYIIVINLSSWRLKYTIFILKLCSICPVDINMLCWVQQIWKS